MTIQSVSDLIILLNANGIDASSWGRAGFKSLENLYSEIINGDCLISEDAIRQISIAVIRIELDGFLLYENGQRLRNGYYRERKKLPREKIKLGENINSATIRCMSEELRLGVDDFKVISINEDAQIYLKNSASYPNLNTRYKQYDVVVETDALPFEDFSTKESGDIYDPVEVHYWKWIKK